MSVCYVIKNKDGKYFAVARDSSYYWTDDIFLSYRFMPLSESHDIESEAKEYRDIHYPSCEVVEITITEVDKNLTPLNYDNLSIEDKLKYRENQVRIARDRDVEYNNKITELEFTIKRLEEELAEKDKMIEQLNFEKRNTLGLIEKVSIKGQLEIRKQVCDEIRDFIGKHDVLEPTRLFAMDLLRKIDQIKKGECNGRRGVSD